MPFHRELDLNKANIGELIAEVLRLQSDLTLIGAEFVQQAIQREWCGEYDHWARIMNRRTSRPHFITRDDLEDHPFADNGEDPQIARAET